MMDDFSLGHEIIDPIMDELEVVNKLLGGYNVFFNAFKKIGIKDGMSISDWGCGGGDSLRVIAKWARKRNLKIRLIGVDATESAIEYARERSKDFPEISYIFADVMSEKLMSNQFDIVISSLFTNSPTISILPDIPHRLEQIRLAILAFPTERQNQREPILGELEVLARELARPQEDRIDLVLQRSWRIVTEFLGDHLSIRETASYLEPHGIHLP